MSLKTLIQEAINNNAAGFESALEEELRTRINESLANWNVGIMSAPLGDGPFKLKKIVATSPRGKTYTYDDEERAAHWHGKDTWEKMKAGVGGWKVDLDNKKPHLDEGVLKSYKKIEDVPDQDLKWHVSKNIPHMSFTRQEMKDEHKRRQRYEPGYNDVKPKLSEAVHPADKNADMVDISRGDMSLDDALKKYTKSEIKKGLKDIYPFHHLLKSKHLSEAMSLHDYEWPASALHSGSSLGDHAQNAIRHGMHAYDALDHIYSAADKEGRDWIRSNRDNLIDTFRSYGLRTEDVEQIDEVSGAKLGDYIVKSRADVAARKERGEKMRQEIIKQYPELKGIGRPIDHKTYKRPKSQQLAVKKLTGQARVNATEKKEG